MIEHSKYQLKKQVPFASVNSFSFVLLLFTVKNFFDWTINPLNDLVKKHMIIINRSVLYWHNSCKHISSYSENVDELILYCCLAKRSVRCNMQMSFQKERASGFFQFCNFLYKSKFPWNKVLQLIPTKINLFSNPEVNCYYLTEFSQWTNHILMRVSQSLQIT